MKKKLKIIIPAVWLGMLLIAITYNSASEPSKRIPFVPVVDISINGRELPVVKKTTTVTGSVLANELHAHKIFPVLRMADRDYSIVEHDDALELLAWSMRFYWQTPALRYVPEAYDCDNFARTFVVLGDLSYVPHLDKATPSGQIAFFRIYVKQERAWGGVPAGGYHALGLMRTSEGWYVFEPQSGASIQLAKYVNLKQVLEVLFD